MTQRSALHNTFTITRVYDAPPSRVFAAFADPKAKAKWFSPPPDWVDVKQSVEFRVGGREHSSARDSSGVKHVFDSIYYDIVPDARIVYAYDMHLNEQRISVSLGDVVSIYGSVIRVGRSSMAVKLETIVARRLDPTEIKVTEGVYTYVAIDENGRPRPVPDRR